MPPTVSLVFAAVFLVVPPLVLVAMGKSPRASNHLWLVGASAAVALSWDLPSPWFAEHTATFSQHLLGGGVSSALVAMYFMAHLTTPTWKHRLMLVVAVTSILGVANEVLELGLDMVRGTTLRRDASFDLLANMIGAFGTWVVIELIRKR